MRICLIGKYPPIEGGVSARAYWTARWLAARGHQVHVVTNADEVEPAFRMRFLPGDEEWLAGVRVWSTERHGPSMRHIPDHNPFVSKLTSLAITAVEELGADVIVSSYLEPYAVAGFLAATFTGVPLVVRHAGSDVGRLLGHDQLGPCYEMVLRHAALVCGSPSTVERFAGMGVPADRLHLDPGFALPDEVFHPGAVPTDVTDVPTIGVYGKVGEAKGSYDLVAALGELASRGREFRFSALVGGTPDERGRFQAAIGEAGIEERTRVLPFVAHWHVPGFLRSLNAACFLERDFPLDHNPGIPQEVMAVGVPLVTTTEIARKQPFAPRLVHGFNCIVVRDPRDTDELAAALDQVVDDRSGAAVLGERGRSCLPTSGVQPFLTRYEAMLERAVGRARPSGAQRWRPFDASRRVIGPTAERLERALGSGTDSFADAVALCDAFADHWRQAPETLPPYTGELLRWELHQVADPDKAAGADDLLFRRMPSEPAALVPTVADNVEVRIFPYDMDALREAVINREVPPADWPEEASCYVFQHLPGYRKPRLIRISVEVYELLTAVDGRADLSSLDGQARHALSNLLREGVLLVANT